MMVRECTCTRVGTVVWVVPACDLKDRFSERQPTKTTRHGADMGRPGSVIDVFPFSGRSWYKFSVDSELRRWRVSS